MANPDAPFGFRVASHVSGGTPARCNEYLLSSAYNTALFQGDIVKRGADGNVVIGTAGDPFIGIFNGVRYTATDGSVVFKNNWVASTATKSGTLIYAYVYDDPNLIYEVQSDSSMTTADIGLFCDIVTSTAGNATTGISGQQTGTVASTEDQFVITGIITDKPCRDSNGNQSLLASGTNARIYVKPVNHQLGPAVLVTEQA